jgi:hypothetical protein
MEPILGWLPAVRLSVEPTDLFGEVVQQGCRGDDGSSGLLNEIVASDPAAMAVNAFPKPLKQWIEPTVGKVVIEIGHFHADCAHEAGGLNIAQSVGWKVSE